MEVGWGGVVLCGWIITVNIPPKKQKHTSLYVDDMSLIGNFRKKNTELLNTTFDDLVNPFNFYQLLLAEAPVLLEWLRKNMLLMSEVTCCGKKCSLNKRKSALGILNVFITSTY